MKNSCPIPLNDLLEELIRIDLKHFQLILGLQALDFDSGNHYLPIFELVRKLLQLEESEQIEKALSCYSVFMQKAAEFPITPLGEELRGLAKECYAQLKGIKGGD